MYLYNLTNTDPLDFIEFLKKHEVHPNWYLPSVHLIFVYQPTVALLLLKQAPLTTTQLILLIECANALHILHSNCMHTCLPPLTIYYYFSDFQLICTHTHLVINPHLFFSHLLLVRSARIKKHEAGPTFQKPTRGTSLASIYLCMSLCVWTYKNGPGLARAISCCMCARFLVRIHGDHIYMPYGMLQ